MKRFTLVVFWVITAAVLASAQTSGYFPQIADGVQGGGITWKMTIYVTNPAPSVLLRCRQHHIHSFYRCAI
jgi:hypothetical protein